jgi:hypothetical protein
VRSAGEDLVRRRGGEDTSPVNRLDQLIARSQREIEAHASELATTEAGRDLIFVAAHLLAGLRLWAENRYRSDQVVRDILESVNVVVLNDVARHLLASGTIEGQVAGESVAEIAGRRSAELRTVASYALLAL